jgi:uncharacterized membrane protein
MDFKKLAITVVVLIVIDTLWLFTGGQFAIRMTEKIQGSSVVFRYGSALIVYIALAYLHNTFATSIKEAFALGLSTYAVYDFTNYALLKDYDFRFAVADTVWGGVLFSMVHSVMDYIRI